VETLPHANLDPKKRKETMLKLAYSIAATSAVAASALGVSFVAANLRGETQEPHESKTSTLKVSAPSTGRFRIKIPLGTVKIETGGVSVIEVHADRWSKTPMSDAGRRWLQNSKLMLTNNAGEDILQDYPMGDESNKSLKKDFNGGLDLTIRVPAGLDVFIENGAGTIDSRGDYRTYSLHLGAGEVTTDLASCPTRNSELHVGAGEVKLHLPARSNADVTASTGVGTVEGLPATERNANGIHVGDSRSARFGSGGTKLSVHVGAGEISITSPDTRKPGPKVAQSEDGRADKFGKEVDDDSMAVDIDQGVRDATKNIDRDVARALSQIQPEIDKEMANLPHEIEQAMDAAQPEIDKALREARIETQKALKELGPQLKRELGKIQPEIDRALAEAMKAMKDSSKIRKQTKAETEKAIKEAMKAVREAEKALKEHNHDTPSLVELP